MNHRDVWFVGLLALAYLYLDAAAREAPARPVSDDPADVLGDADASEACPRDLSHRISLRADGAMWCLACDEGFFPAGLVVTG